MPSLLSLDALLGLATLTLMEIVLGIDNIVFIAILVAKLPASQQELARRLGITLALGIRVLLLLTISWIMRLTEPILTVGERGVSGRDLILLGGGLFLIFKATREIYEKVEGGPHEVDGSRSSAVFGWVLVQILLLDIVFSLDSVITAVGMANQVSVMIIAMVLAMLVMLVSAGAVSGFVERHPSFKILALAFLLLIGVMLVAEGTGSHVSKGYVYFAMAFSLFVEMLNMRYRRRTQARRARARSMSSESRTALVTGAARGIGLAIARRLAADGLRIALLDLDRDRVEAEARDLGRDAVALGGDVTRSGEVDAAVRAVVDRWGRLDVLVNNAGITGRSFPIWELDDADWERVLAVDLTSVFYCCRAAIRVMLRQGSGRIVNIASIAGKEGNPTLIPYSSAKAGVIGLTKALAKEVATRGIFVNAVAPAVISTELLQQMERSTVDLLVSKIPMGRVGRPEEVAALVAWLASEECSFSTGAVYDLSGGRATY